MELKKCCEEIQEVWKKYNICPTCRGEGTQLVTGYDNNHIVRDCDTCKGTGKYCPVNCCKACLKLSECNAPCDGLKINDKLKRTAEPDDMIKIKATGEIKKVAFVFMGGVHLRDNHFTSVLDGDYELLEGEAGE